jgi:hypothetical protein
MTFKMSKETITRYILDRKPNLYDYEIALKVWWRTERGMELTASGRSILMLMGFTMYNVIPKDEYILSGRLLLNLERYMTCPFCIYLKGYDGFVSVIELFGEKEKILLELCDGNLNRFIQMVKA